MSTRLLHILVSVCLVQFVNDSHYDTLRWFFLEISLFFLAHCNHFNAKYDIKNDISYPIGLVKFLSDLSGNFDMWAAFSTILSNFINSGTCQFSRLQELQVFFKLFGCAFARSYRDDFYMILHQFSSVIFSMLTVYQPPH